MVKCLPCGFTAQMSCNMDRASIGFHHHSMCHKERYRLLDILTALIRSMFLSWCWHKWPGVCVAKYYSIALQKIERDLHLFCDSKSSIVNPVEICMWIIGFVVMAWWRHQMETFSALLATCAGNSPVPVKSPHKGQWHGALMFSLICVWINGWVNNREAGDLRRYRAHYDVSVMASEKHLSNLVGKAKITANIYEFFYQILIAIEKSLCLNFLYTHWNTLIMKGYIFQHENVRICN